jgi:hypothetical protein
MAEQFLTDFKAPFINGIAAKRILVNEVLQNIYQGEIESENRGVSQKFTTDVSGAQIRILRVLPLTQQARELGSGLNGENFSGGVEQPRTEQYGLDVITVIDTPVDIPNVNQDMLPIDLMEKVTKEISNLINLNTNAMTIAGKIHKTFTDVANANVIYFDPTSQDPTALQTAFLLANAKLDDGDLTHGVAMFPMDDRVAVIQTSYRAKLLTKGVLVLGGSNYAQEMLAAGVLSPGAKTNKLENGYVGDFDGVPVHIVSSLIWRTTEKYLGLPVGELNSVIGYFSSGLANVRGIAYNENMKIIDSPQGPGVRLQPLFRMGFKSLYTKGNVFIFEGKEQDVSITTNPLATIDAVVPGTAKLLAPGSRFAPTITVNTTSGNSASISTTLGAGKTLLGNNVQYYWLPSSLAGNYANIPTTLSGFDYIVTKTFGSNSFGQVNGTFGNAFFSNVYGSLGNNASHTIWAKAIDSDGTATVTKSTFVL